MALFSKLFGARPASAASFATPANARAYAIGDVHGCLDELRTLLDRIEADSQARPCEREYIIFLGDLVDRGPQSAQVIDYLLRTKPFLPNPIFLMGNHEEMLLRILKQDADQVWDWLSFGGSECMQSYGLEPAALSQLNTEEAIAAIRRAIPPAHLDFIQGFNDTFKFGDYLFVHAGLRPGVPLDQQTTHDLRWIREDFLTTPARFPFLVVHGHTISPEPDERPNRIGIDTGAYKTGILTALCVEGDTRRFINTK